MSEFVEVKTAELLDEALDWAVAQVEGVEYLHAGIKCRTRLTSRTFHHYTKPNFMPSTDWSQGGPLIEKRRVDVREQGLSGWACDICFHKTMTGPTVLIAACRAIVASVLGDTVSVPKELLS